MYECSCLTRDKNAVHPTQKPVELLEYLIKSFTNEGDTVLIEQPTYFGAINVFKNRKVNLVGIDLTEEGFDFGEFDYRTRQWR